MFFQPTSFKLGEMIRTVLIVDDVPFVRKTLNKILTDAHYQVVGEASNGREAVNLYQTLRPDLITMDVVMPEMSGVDAARTIIKIDKNAKIIMVSAMGQEQLVMESINAGVRDYILKPFQKEDILKTIQHISAADSQGTRKSATR